MVELTLLADDHSYPYVSNNLEARYIANALVAATADRRGMTAMEIHRQLRVPRTTVGGHLRRLQATGLVIKTRNVYSVDTNKLDALLIDDEDVDRCIELITQSLYELQQHRARRREARLRAK